MPPSLCYDSLCVRCYCYPIAATRFSPPVRSISQQRHVCLLKRCRDAIKPQSRVIILSDNCRQSPLRIVHTHPHSPCVRFVRCLAQYSRWDFGVWRGGGSSTLIKLFVGYIWIFFIFITTVCLWRPVNWELHCTFINHCLLIRSLANFDTHPPRLLMMNHMHIRVRRYPWYTPISWTVTASLISQNVPSWLKFLLEWEPQTPICYNGHFVFCHLAFKVYWFQVTAPEYFTVYAITLRNFVILTHPVW